MYVCLPPVNTFSRGKYWISRSWYKADGAIFALPIEKLPTKWKSTLNEAFHEPWSFIAFLSLTMKKGNTFTGWFVPPSSLLNRIYSRKYYVTSTRIILNFIRTIVNYREEELLILLRQNAYSFMNMHGGRLAISLIKKTLPRCWKTVRDNGLRFHFFTKNR